MSEHDVMALLDASGVTAGASPQQRAVLAALTSEEAEVLVSVRSRLSAAEPDVAAHINDFGGTFW